jgi:superfamily I DNA and RNA helicase
MNDIIPDIDNELDVIFGEYRDMNAVQDFVASIRAANFTGTLYIGYPVLTVDDERIEFDAVLVSRNRGVIVFDLYSFDGGAQGQPQGIAVAVTLRQEQQFAALYNKLNSFGDLRKNRQLIVDITTASIHPIADVYLEQDDAILLGPNRLDELPKVDDSNLLSDLQIEHLNAAIQRISNLRPKKTREDVVKPGSKGAIIKEIEKQIANLDLWQKRGSIEYVNGPQRIRGLAGSGKTVVLALKAAYLHVKRPDWHIAVTFNTRSLYQQFESLVNRFVFSQINDEPDWS